MHHTPASAEQNSLFNLVKSFDRLLGTSTNQFDSTPEFVANIFSSILYQVRRAEQTPLRHVTISLPTATPEPPKLRPKSPPPAVKQKPPCKQKQQKQADKATEAQIYAQHVQRWQNPNHIEPPPSYSICRSPQMTVAPPL